MKREPGTVWDGQNCRNDKVILYKMVLSRGFTLVELLVVITILSILIAVLIPNLAGGTEKAKEAKAKSLITNLANLANLYRMDYGYYPESEESEPWSSSYLAYHLNKKGSKNKPYYIFKESEVSSYPITDEFSSKIRNPANPAKFIYYRNNQMDFADEADPKSFNPPIMNVDGIDIWCEDLSGKKTGISNW